MSTTTISELVAARRAGRGGFGQLVRAEWTKFRTVRGWVIGMVVAAILTVSLGVFVSATQRVECHNSPNGPQLTGRACLGHVPLGPGGEAVTDSFYFAHQSLSGNGSIAAQVASFTGGYLGGNVSAAQASQHPSQGPPFTPGLVGWAKAGIMIKADTKQGSAYAAMMLTGGHGARMQWDYVNDTAGLPGRVSAASPRWLRLVRSGDAITGYDSENGRTWSEVGTAELTGLSATVQVGMFATSPAYVMTTPMFGGRTRGTGGPGQATAVFDDIRVSAAPAGRAWVGTAIGGGGPVTAARGFTQVGDAVTVTGSGDIAPLVDGATSGVPVATIEQNLGGLFIGLIAIVIVAAMFFTAEYRRGLIRTTLAATPGRGRVLAAKAVVIGSAAFVVALVAFTLAIKLGVPDQRAQGQYVLPVSALTEARVVVGTAAMVGLCAVFAVAVGAVLRRSAAAVTAVIVLVVLPFLLATLNAFPSGLTNWLLSVTPTAGLAIEQSIPHYPQVAAAGDAASGYFPLVPWAGFAVLCAWVAAALGLAFVTLRRRDA